MLWEARPLHDGENRGLRKSIFDKLATVDRVVVPQSGTGTHDHVRFVKVRRYSGHKRSFPAPPLVQEIIDELSVDLLPEVEGTWARVGVHDKLPSTRRRLLCFVAMRLP